MYTLKLNGEIKVLPQNLHDIKHIDYSVNEVNNLIVSIVGMLDKSELQYLIKYLDSPTWYVSVKFASKSKLFMAVNSLLVYLQRSNLLPKFDDEEIKHRVITYIMRYMATKNNEDYDAQ